MTLVEGMRAGALEHASRPSRATRGADARRHSPRATSPRTAAAVPADPARLHRGSARRRARPGPAPAVRAASLPKLRDSRSNATRASSRANRCSSAQVPVAAAVVDIQHARLRGLRPRPCPSATRMRGMQARQGILLVEGGDHERQAAVFRHDPIHRGKYASRVTRAAHMHAPHGDAQSSARRYPVPRDRAHLPLDRRPRGAARRVPACAAL